MEEDLTSQYSHEPQGAIDRLLLIGHSFSDDLSKMRSYSEWLPDQYYY